MLYMVHPSAVIPAGKLNGLSEHTSECYNFYPPRQQHTEALENKAA